MPKRIDELPAGSLSDNSLFVTQQELNNNDVTTKVTGSQLTSYISSNIDLSEITQDISDLKTVVGDSSSGLVKEVNDIVRLPAVTSTDSGKVLSVDNSGDWTVSDVTAVIESQIETIQKTLDNLLNPPQTELYAWDFTQSTDYMIDTINGDIMVAVGNVSHDTDGIKLEDASSVVSATAATGGVGRTVKWELGSSTFVGRAANPSLSAGFGRSKYAFSFMGNVNKWGWCYHGYFAATLKTFDNLTNPLLLKNGSVTLKCIDSDSVEVYVNDQYVGTVDNYTGFTDVVSFGSSQNNSYGPIYIKKCTVYG